MTAGNQQSVAAVQGMGLRPNLFQILIRQGQGPGEQALQPGPSLFRRSIGKKLILCSKNTEFEKFQELMSQSQSIRFVSFHAAHPKPVCERQRTALSQPCKRISREPVLIHTEREPTTHVHIPHGRRTKRPALLD